MKEVYVVYEKSGRFGQYSRLICVFSNKEEAYEFCKSANTPSHVNYTGSYLEAISSPMFYVTADAIQAANNGEIRI